ncbi:MAG: hypothetical protein LBC18_09295 [Opitutaceae bacterium]|jgi:hypothetical protein|nr:hypothetical protein [Opitutaceae bacterium]
MKKRNFHIHCDMEDVAGIAGMPPVTPGAHLDGLRRQAGGLFISDDAIRIGASSATAAWADCRQLKPRVQAKL